MPGSIGRGRSSSLIAAADGRVVKLFDAGTARACVEAERAAQDLARGLGLPVPRPFAVVEHDGRLGLEMERLDGMPLLHRFARHPLGLARAFFELGRLHAAIHAHPGPGLPAQHGFVERHIRAARLPPDLEHAALARLAALPAGDRLCHGDLHPQNVVWTAAGPFAIDWRTATCGDPAADVARTLMLLRLGPLPAGMAFLAPLRRVGAWLYLAAYRRHGRYAPAAVRAWALPTLAARLGGDNARERPMLLPMIAALAAKGR